MIGRYAAESGVVLAVETVRDSLARIVEPADRAAYLNSLEVESGRKPENALGDERFSIVYVDVNSRLDVNNASQSQLAKLFAYFVGPEEATSAARSVRQWVDESGEEQQRSGNSIPARSDLTYPRMPGARPLRTLEELRRIPGVPERLAVGAAPYLTVDGDGRINRGSASDTVMSAAAGSLVDEPTRILIISRGWLNGHPLTHEIQAVYGIEGNSTVLVRWQERDL